MNYQKAIKATIYTAVSVWAVLLLKNGETFHSSALKPLSTVTSVVIWLAVAFDLFVWKLPFLQGWLVKRPVLDGTWRVALQSNWVSPETGRVIPPIHCYMIVRQTLTSLSMRLLTQESESVLLGAELITTADGLYRITGVYENTPAVQYRHRSEIHFGAIWLAIARDNGVAKMEGHYWTDRDTKGFLLLTERRPEKVQSFQAAEKIYSVTAGPTV